MERDEAVDQYARMLGVPAAIVRSDEAVAEMRHCRAEQQAQMQQMAAAAQMAQTANQKAWASLKTSIFRDALIYNKNKF